VGRRRNCHWNLLLTFTTIIEPWYQQVWSKIFDPIDAIGPRVCLLVCVEHIGTELSQQMANRYQFRFGHTHGRLHKQGYVGNGTNKAGAVRVSDRWTLPVFGFWGSLSVGLACGPRFKHSWHFSMLLTIVDTRFLAFFSRELAALCRLSPVHMDIYTVTNLWKGSLLNCSDDIQKVLGFVRDVLLYNRVRQSPQNGW
jgi:hypothetical protein